MEYKINPVSFHANTNAFIKEALERMVTNGAKGTPEYVLQKVGCSRSTIRKHRAKDSKIDQLYKKVVIPYKQPIQSPEIYKKIMILFTQKIQTGQRTSLNALAAELNITKAQICCRLRCSETLRKMYDQIKLKGSLCRPYKRKPVEIEREELIRNLLLETKNQGKKISIDEIAETLDLPLHQVVTSIYSKKSTIKDLFLSVSKAKKLHVADKYNKRADEIVEQASQYFVTEPNDEFNDSAYNGYLASCLAKNNMSNDAVNAFSVLFEKYPGFANDLLMHKAGSRHRRLSDLKTAKTINILMSAYEINPELTEKLTFEVNNKYYKYSPIEVLYKVKISQFSDELAENEKELYEFIFSLLKMKNNDKTPRFSISEIKKIIEAERNQKQRSVLNLAIKRRESNNNEYSYNYRQIRKILEFYKEEPELTLEFLTSKKATQYKYLSDTSEKIIDEYFDAKKKCDTYKKDLIKNLIKKSDEQNISDDETMDVSIGVLKQIADYNTKIEIIEKIKHGDTSYKTLTQFINTFGITESSIMEQLQSIGLKEEEAEKVYRSIII